MRVATFNLQNMRLRQREGRSVLDGAADHDFDGWSQSIRDDLADRQLTAKVIATANAEVVALQEVFDTETLDFFHDHFLLQAGLDPYPYRICLPGNDGRGLNVASMSKRKPVRAKSHAQLTGADFNLTELPANLRNQRLFRRDCLQLDFVSFTLFICHFKAPYPDTDRAYVIREAEARAVRQIIETRFSRPENERWMIMGDFNEPALVDQTVPSALKSLTQGFSIDLLDRLPRGKDWTFEVPDTHVHSRPDRIFLSPELAKEYPDVVPTILRTGMTRYLSEPIANSSLGPPNNQSHASDHALVYADFPGL
jgi:endonuclease/exonuclease/phosphatase family metal-dependent hydrolase